MEGILTHQSPSTGDAPGPRMSASKTSGAAPGQASSYTPAFGAPITGTPTPGLIQVNLATVQRSLEAARAATPLPQLANLTRKRARTDTPSQITASRVEDATGTPRTARMKNLLPEGDDKQSLGTILEKLLEVTMAGINFKDKGRTARKIQVDSESAEDILVLAAAAFDLHKLDQSKKILFQPGRRMAQTPASAAVLSAQSQTPANFDSQSAELSTKLDSLAEQVAALTTAIKKPSSGPAKAPSYALAASKHATKVVDLTATEKLPGAQATRRSATRPTTTITLSQTDRTQPALTELTAPRLLFALNSHLRTKQIKVQDTSKTTVKVKSVQRHTFNDLILHLESPSHADALRKTVETWLPSFSDKLTLKAETHAILVHGIPTTFNPKNPEHLEDLIASNGARLSSFSAIRWMNIKAVEEENKRYSSIIIFLTDRKAAQRCVKDQVWYRFNKKRTKMERRPPSRCFNCLQSGHTAAACPQPSLCPYCGDNHHAHSCDKKGLTPPKCTTCAREKKKLNPQVNTKGIFAANPTDLLHSPFDPNCAVRQARTPNNESSHSLRITTRPEADDVMSNV